MGTDADFKLDRLMAKASDFQGKHDMDEARDGKAMWNGGGQALWSGGARQQGGASTKRHRVDDGEPFGKCSICTKGWHTAAQSVSLQAVALHI
jgi:hypothetical protein